MGRIIATLIAAVGLVLSTGAASVRGQASCSFVQGFATLRDLAGAQKVGACLENERFNVENGNAEQRTAGGLMVWRKADNFTAFTDGGTTWVNGPNGLESRPNDERFAWERDPVVAARSVPASPSTSPATSPVPTSPEPALASSGQGAAPVGDGAPTGDGIAQAAVSTPTSPPTSTATPTAAATVAPTAAPTKATTPTPTPNAVQVKFTERPNRVDTGNDARFEVETSARKGTCALAIAYRNTATVGIGSKDIDDGRCEWKFTLAADTKTGKATAYVTITAKEGTATVEDTFDVRKGDVTYGGDVELELDADDLPNRVSVGQQFDVSIDTDLKNRGTCDLTVTWPKIGPEAGARKTPDGNGRCTWKMTVPASITKDGEATLVVVVTRNKNSTRTLTKEFDIRK